MSTLNPFYSTGTYTSGPYTVHIGFTSRSAGNLGLHVNAGEPHTATLKNRADVQSLCGSAPFLYLNQVHGADIVCADHILSTQISPNDERGAYTLKRADQLREQAPQADAAYSTTGQPLAIMVADCIPLVFVGEKPTPHDHDVPIIAVAHAGRPGLLAGVIQRTVATMREQGATQIHAWLGPSICGSCYEVPEDMREHATQQIPETYAQTSQGTPALDLPAGAIALLNKLKIEVSTDLAACTYESTSLFSHRRFMNRGEAPGRTAGLVWVTKPS